ncbi:hypothetical protein [Kitasatospora sp. McL0602]|uniref:hypothetical protein n=1 Tax=Kitasatospora sp. McL0602 TaxID=3439530 RepID=UPI003F89EDB9
MPDSTEAVSKRDVEVVHRYLRVFETKQVAELEELGAEDVLVHGAGRHGQGRQYAGSMQVTLRQVALHH